MPILSIFAVMFAFARESFRLFSKPQYRSMLIWVGILLAIGTAFYNTVEGWGWLDSLYFCVVTLATVGYGDLTPTTALGKVFAIVYILLGLGIIATFASMLAKERIDMLTERQGDKDGAAQQAN